MYFYRENTFCYSSISTRGLAIHLTIRTLEVAARALVPSSQISQTRIFLLPTDLLLWLLPMIINLRTSYFSPLIKCLMYWVFLSSIVLGSSNDFLIRARNSAFVILRIQDISSMRLYKYISNACSFFSKFRSRVHASHRYKTMEKMT